MARSRIAAATAVVALVGASFLAGIGAASAAPVLNVLSPTTGPLSTAFTTFSGEASGDSAIEIDITNQFGTDNYACTTTPPSATPVPWTCDIPDAFIELGPATVTVRAIDLLVADVPTEVTQTFDIYGATPDLTFDAPLTGNEHLVVFSGHGPALGSAIIDACGTTTAIDATGSWSCPAAAAVPFGSHSATGTAQTYDGVVGAPVTHPYVVAVPDPVVSYGDGAASWGVTSQPFVDVQPQVSMTTGLPGAPVTSATCTDPICSFPLPPGISRVEVFNLATDGSGEQSAGLRDYIRTPPAPTMDTPTEDELGSIIFTGTGTDGDLARVSTGSAYVCSATVAGGTWTCTIPDPGEGSWTYRAIQLSQGFDATAAGIVDPDMGVSHNGYSELAPPQTIEVEAPVVTPPVVTPPVITPPVVLPATGPPAPAPAFVLTTQTLPPPAAKPPFAWSLTIDGVNGPLKPGQVLGLSSSGIPEGSVVVAELHSTPMHLGTRIVAADGLFAFPVTIPLDAEAGDHHIVVTVTPPGDAAVPITSEVSVEIDPEPAPKDLYIPASSSVTAADSSGAGSGPGETLPRSDPAAPSILDRAIPTVLEVVANPVALCFAAALALAIMLLVAVPAEALNSAIESNSSQLGRLFTRIDDATTRATEWFVRVTRTPAFAAAILVIITAIIFGFIDPQFGFDATSIRLVGSMALALFIVTFVASRITSLIIGRAWSLASSISMQPATLLFSIIGVIIARALEFSPGFLIGLVIGLQLSEHAAELQRVRTISIKIGVIVGLGVIAWLAYSVLLWAQGSGDPTPVSAFAQDTLVAVTAEGITAALIILLPIGYLDGRTLFERSRRLWVITFLGVAAVFSLLVLPTAMLGDEVADLGVWSIVLLAFAATAIGATVWFKRAGSRASADRPAPESVSR